MKYILILSVLLLMSGCVTPPDYEQMLAKIRADSQHRLAKAKIDEEASIEQWHEDIMITLDIETQAARKIIEKLNKERKEKDEQEKQIKNKSYEIYADPNRIIIIQRLRML